MFYRVHYAPCTRALLTQNKGLDAGSNVALILIVFVLGERGGRKGWGEGVGEGEGKEQKGEQ